MPAAPVAASRSAPEPARPAATGGARAFVVLTERRDFLAAARARRQALPGFVVQARRRGEDLGGPRVGFTCSKKVGNAVARNRAKRRLREVARAVLREEGRAGWDYVLIGRATETAQRPLPRMIAELRAVLPRLHGDRAR